jgi:hypothetical protein
MTDRQLMAFLLPMVQSLNRVGGAVGKLVAHHMPKAPDALWKQANEAQLELDGLVEDFDNIMKILRGDHVVLPLDNGNKLGAIGVGLGQWVGIAGDLPVDEQPAFDEDE